MTVDGQSVVLFLVPGLALSGWMRFTVLEQKVTSTVAATNPLGTMTVLTAKTLGSFVVSF